MADRHIEAMAVAICDHVAPDERWERYLDTAIIAYIAMRETLVPAAWLYAFPELHSTVILREDDCATLRREGWTETAVYMLPEVEL